MAGKREKVEKRRLGTLRARTKNLVPAKEGVKNMKTATVKHKTAQRSTRILSINPYTEEVMKKFPLMSTVELNGQVGQSRAAFVKWRDVPVANRAALMKNLATVLRAEKRNYAELITKEMGKPIREALAEVEKCAVLADYYAANAVEFLKPEEIKTEAKKSYVMYQPLGIVLAVMPWNFPFWQALRFGVPAVAAGNVALLKHASNVPMTALAIEEAFTKAGFPDSVFKTLLIDVSQTLGLIDDDLVDAVSLTGSNRAGEDIGAHAGKKIKKVVLELGGSDPYIVLEDADVEKAGRMAANARMINTGQSCIAAKRFIVMDTIAEEFTKHFIARLKELKMGDPMDEGTDIGTVARKDILDGLKEQLRDAKAKGAHRADQRPNLHQRALLHAQRRPEHQTEHEGHDRGGLRPDCPDHHRQGRGRGDQCGERYGVRPWSVPLEQGPCAGRAACGADRGRNGNDQRHGEVRPASALRRHQKIRRRQGDVASRFEGVREREDYRSEGIIMKQ